MESKSKEEIKELIRQKVSSKTLFSPEKGLLHSVNILLKELQDMHPRMQDTFLQEKNWEGLLRAGMLGGLIYNMLESLLYIHYNESPDGE